MHPEQEKALQRHREVAEERQVMKEFVAQAIENGVRFVFIPTMRLTPGLGYQADIHGHGTTIAYRVTRKDVIQISTAISHPDDKPNKLVGRYYAAENFNDGACVMIRRHNHKQPIRHMLEAMFGVSSYESVGY